MILECDLSYKNRLDGVYLYWNAPSIEYSRFKLVRKQYEYPRNASDGKSVYEGSDVSFLDEDVMNGKTYYYRLFVVLNNGEKDSDYITDTRCLCRVVSLLENGSTATLYKNVFSLGRNKDVELDLDNQLYRFMLVNGYEQDILETFIKKLSDIIDVSETDDRFLPFFSEYYGASYDSTLSINDNRRIIKVTIESLDYKGTTHGLEYMLQTLSGSNVDINIPKDKVKFTDGMEAINNRRTVSVFMDTSNEYSWVNERRDKVQEILKSYIRLDYNVRLFISFSYVEDAKGVYNDNMLRSILNTSYSDSYIDKDAFVLKNLRRSDTYRGRLLRYINGDYSTMHGFDDKIEKNVDKVYFNHKEKFDKKMVDDLSEVSVMNNYGTEEYLKRVLIDYCYLNIKTNNNVKMKYLKNDYIEPDELTTTNKEKKDLDVKEEYSMVVSTKEMLVEKMLNTPKEGFLSEITLSEKDNCNIIINDGYLSERVSTSNKEKYLSSDNINENSIRGSLLCRRGNVDMLRGRLTSYDIISDGNSEYYIIN